MTRSAFHSVASDSESAALQKHTDVFIVTRECTSISICIRKVYRIQIKWTTYEDVVSDVFSSVFRKEITKNLRNTDRMDAQMTEIRSV